MDQSEYLIDVEESGYSKSANKFKKDSTRYFKFNPNEFSQKDWEAFDFSPKQAKAIVSYKTRIGGFKNKTDLKKVYVVDADKYSELEPYINIPKSQKKNFEEVKNIELENEIVPVVLVELNSASKEELINLKGIGEFTAKGILEHKLKLGGYHNAQQLLEVYGVSSENMEKIKGQVSVDVNEITKLNVNELSISNLKKHPYISWTIASKIIDKRLGGKLNDLIFLVEDELISNEELKNLLPYIVF
jgi:DNA uptake protein ComE-like DNA-binding protein